MTSGVNKVNIELMCVHTKKSLFMYFRISIELYFFFELYNFPTNSAWCLFVTAYQRSLPEVQVEQKNGRRNVIVAVCGLPELYNITAKNSFRLRYYETIDAGTCTTGKDLQWWISRPWVRMNWRRETLGFIRDPLLRGSAPVPRSNSNAYVGRKCG